MTYRRVEAGLSRLLQLGLDHEITERIEGWKEHLAKGRLTHEMRDVFVALGWLSSARDSRLGDEIEVEEGSTPTDAEIREPDQPGTDLREGKTGRKPHDKDDDA